MNAGRAPILFVNPDPRRYAGCNLSLLSLVAGLPPRFHPIVAMPRDSEMAALLLERGIEVVDLRINNWWYPELTQFVLAAAGLAGRVEDLSRLIRERRVVLVHTNAEYAFEGALAARREGIPHVWNIRQIFSEEMDILRHFPLSKHALGEMMSTFSDCVVPNAHALVGGFPDNIPPEKLRVIPSGVAIADPLDRTAARSALRNRLGLAENTPIVLSMGRISPEKDLMTFVGTARLLITGPGCESAYFIHFGPVTDAGYFQQLKVALGELSRRVIFAGTVDSPLACLRGADVLLFTSTTFEGMARVCLEALLMELPVVSTRCLGPEEYLLHGETALLAAPGDCETLALHVRTLLDDPDLGQKLAAAGRRLVVERYDEKRVNSLWIELYEELTGGDSRQRPDKLAAELFINLLSLCGQVGQQAHHQEIRLKRLEHMVAPFVAAVWSAKRLVRRLVHIFTGRKSPATGKTTTP
jgi:glycosyltransferase involved in cell wall biosynthesis